MEDNNHVNSLDPISNLNVSGSRELNQTADPAVTRLKFQEEINGFKVVERFQRSRGVILLNSEFPNIVLAFAAPQLLSNPIIFGVEINFTNYDLLPPSVKFINPLSGKELTNGNILSVPIPNWFCPVKTHEIEFPDGSKGLLPQYLPSLIQARLDNSLFLCLPGVREYHLHPGHSGDSWFLHRQRGEGTLGFIIDQLYKFGIQPLNKLQAQIQIGSYFIDQNPMLLSE